ncbi:MAG: hypothetical protein ABIO39_04115 [Caulobacteraceae bacterium]
MKTLKAPAVIGLALALAAPALVHASTGANVSVTVGPALQKKTKSYGAREIEEIRKDLQEQVARAIAKSPSPVARVDVVLEDATPNRPTFDQLGRNVGLSMQSVGVGGAKMSGVVHTADGRQLPFRYGWYETDIKNEVGAVTWSDAYRAFGMLAHRVGKGDLPTSYGPGANSNGDGDFGNFGAIRR